MMRSPDGRCRSTRSSKRPNVAARTRAWHRTLGCPPARARSGAKRPEPRCVGCAAIPGPCLLVYDNAVDADPVPGWTPSLGRVQTVVTTDHRNMDGVGDVVDVA